MEPQHTAFNVTVVIEYGGKKHKYLLDQRHRRIVVGRLQLPHLKKVKDLQNRPAKGLVVTDSTHVSNEHMLLEVTPVGQELRLARMLKI